MSGALKNSTLLAAADLECALHDLAQPLTALAFLTQMASMGSDSDTWRQALDAAGIETERAMVHLRRVREAAARLAGMRGNVL